MRILLTGHLGFVGRHLYRRLIEEGHHVIGLDRKQDGNDVRLCELPNDVDLVIHLAARPGVRQSLQMPDVYWLDNIQASQRIFDHYEQLGIRVLYASSSSAKRWWLNPYATTKRVMEQIAPRNALGMRFHTVYGFDSRPDMLYDKILNRSVMYITNHTRDFTHIEDVVSAIVMLMDTDIRGVVDIGTGIPVSISQLVAAAGISAPVLEVSHEQDETCADPIELFDMGWRPTKDIFEELKNDIIRISQMEEHTKYR